MNSVFENENIPEDYPEILSEIMNKVKKTSSLFRTKKETFHFSSSLIHGFKHGEEWASLAPILKDAQVTQLALVKAHWEYIESLLSLHNSPDETIFRCKAAYYEGFALGFELGVYFNRCEFYTL